MYPVNAAVWRFSEAEVLGIPSLFTILAVERSTVPQGMYAYDIQLHQGETGKPYRLAPVLPERRLGTILTASPIDLPPAGALVLKPGDFFERPGGARLTVSEFEAKYLGGEG